MSVSIYLRASTALALRTCEGDRRDLPKKSPCLGLDWLFLGDPSFGDRTTGDLMGERGLLFIV
jgi:hypothetical protein